MKKMYMFFLFLFSSYALFGASVTCDLGVAIGFAARTGDMKLLVDLLDKEDLGVNALNNLLSIIVDTTEAPIAVRLDMLDLLVQKGAQVNHVANRYRGESLLHQAVNVGFQNIKIIKFLVEKSANPDALDNKGKPPVYYTNGAIEAYLAPLTTIEIPEEYFESCAQDTMWLMDEEMFSESDCE